MYILREERYDSTSWAASATRQSASARTSSVDPGSAMGPISTYTATTMMPVGSELTIESRMRHPTIAQ